MTHGKEIPVDVLQIDTVFDITKEYLLQFELGTPIYKRYKCKVYVYVEHNYV
jgi:hypothetical protein